MFIISYEKPLSYIQAIEHLLYYLSCSLGGHLYQELIDTRQPIRIEDSLTLWYKLCILDINCEINYLVTLLLLKP